MKNKKNHEKQRLSWVGSFLWITAFFLIFLIGGCQFDTPLTDPNQFAPTPTVVIQPDTVVPYYIDNDVPNSIRFSKIEFPEGFSRNTIYAITQDDIGFIWFGTENGLLRYDGNDFIRFLPEANTPGSLSDRWITTLLPDGSGNLWVGTRQGGLNFFDSKTGLFTQYLYDAANPNSLSSNRVNTLYIDRKNQLWVGTNAGLDLFDPSENIFRHFVFGGLANSTDSLSTLPSITAIYEDGDGVFWIGTEENGLVRLDIFTGLFTVFSHDPEDGQTVASNTIRGVLPAQDKSIWIGTDAGLDLLIPQTTSFVHYKHSNTDTQSLADDAITVMALDRSGNLWLGTHSGLDCFDSRRNRFNHFSHDALDAKSLSTNTVLAIFESRDDILWISTYGGNIDKYYRGIDRFTYFHSSSQNPYAISGNLINQISIDRQGYVWIATADGGVNRLSPSFSRFLSFQHNSEDEGSLSSNVVWSVYKDSKDILWVGTSLGLDRLNPGTDDFTHYPTDAEDIENSMAGIVYDIAEDQVGDVWFGTGNGLVRFDRKQNKFVHYLNTEERVLGINESVIVELYFDHSDRLWIGTFMNGLICYDPKNGEFTEYRNDPDDEKSLSNDSVFSVYQDRQGRIWVGTGGGGVNLLDVASGTFAHYNEDDGLASNTVYGILEDIAGRLWISTNKGISCFDPVKLTFVTYNESDGLQGNEFNMNAYAQSRDDSLYFGGVNGLTSFNPLDVYASKYVPPVVLLSVTHNNVNIPVESITEGLSEIKLEWPYTDFEFSFAALSYADPQRNQLSYRLVGVDDQWIDASSSGRGRYMNLPGGTYTLQLRGSNADGVWNKRGISLIVRVIPPIWQRSWFQIGLGGLFIGLVIAVLLGRNANIKANTRKLEQQVVERTKEIENLSKKQKSLRLLKNETAWRGNCMIAPNKKLLLLSRKWALLQESYRKTRRRLTSICRKRKPWSMK